MSNYATIYVSSKWDGLGLSRSLPCLLVTGWQVLKSNKLLLEGVHELAYEVVTKLRVWELPTINSPITLL